jgi:ankyrin repeat protein
MLNKLCNLFGLSKSPSDETLDALAVDPEVRSMIHAADSGNLVTLRNLLRTMDARGTDEDGRTALMYAARSGQAECVKLLIPVSDVKATTRGRQSALHWAASAGQSGMLRTLLPLSDANAKDSLGDTALSVCARLGDIRGVRLLLDSTTDCRGALMSAVCLNRPHCVKLLLERAKPQDCARRDGRGETPLSRSVSDGSVECLELLLPAYGAKDLRELHAAAKRALDLGKSKTHALIQGRVAELERDELARATPAEKRLPTTKPVRF